MPKFITPRSAAALAVLAFAAAPVAAHAADTDATGTLAAGALTNTAPSITAFSATLSGVNQTKTTNVGAWSVNDATGSNLGYSVTVSASAPTVDGVEADAGTGGSLTLTPTAATAAAGNPAGTGPVAQAAGIISDGEYTIHTAAPGTGQGQWNVAAGTNALSVVVPGDASAGAYSSTLTYTASQPVI